MPKQHRCGSPPEPVDVLFTAGFNVLHDESHFTTHVYLTVMHYCAILNHLAVKIAVYTALRRQCSGCIIQVTTCLQITERHIFTG